jgi:hypothetical protein
MTMTRPRVLAIYFLLAALVCVGIGAAGQAAPPRASGSFQFEIAFPARQHQAPIDGRLLLMISNDDRAEPRFQIDETMSTQVILGVNVDGMQPGAPAIVDEHAAGYPIESLREVPPGTYTVQALLQPYETFHRADGKTVKLPMDRGEGRQWNRAPGNLYSTPRKIVLDPRKPTTISIELDKIIPAIADPPDTRYVKHVRIRSEHLTKFWGRPMFLGAHVLLPDGFDAHPAARYPLVIDHGHFPQDFDGFREQPPDPKLKPEYSERFHWEGYNRTEQEGAYQFYKDWTAPGFPRFLLIQIQHANPYYDDSYAVNSENLGPYGDAINEELIPFIEKRYRGLGQGWARFMYGGSTGGWEALGVQLFYPDFYNGCFAACPDPIDFRQFTVIDLYKDKNAYYSAGPWTRVARPGGRNYLGHVSTTIEAANRLELVLGDKGRSGGQWDIWQAVYSPVNVDGYPKPIWNKKTGVIDPDVAAYWREHYDLGYLLRRDWDKIGPKLRGKIHIYVGEADSYFLNNAVYLVEDFLESTRTPPYEGVVDYGARAEHCWNGDHTRPNAISRLRYAQMFAPKIVERILKSAPPGADLTSWRY